MEKSNFSYYKIIHIFVLRELFNTFCTRNAVTSADFIREFLDPCKLYNIAAPSIFRLLKEIDLKFGI